MNLNDYILEGMSDIDVSDIEIAQAFAEMAVLDAMINCYEKQMVLLEYNEESADEILTESFTEMPFLEEYFEEAAKKKEASSTTTTKTAPKFTSAVKIVTQGDDKAVFAYNERKPSGKEAQMTYTGIIDSELFTFSSKEQADKAKKLLDAKMKATGKTIDDLKNAVGKKDGLSKFLRSIGAVPFNFGAGTLDRTGAVVGANDAKNDFVTHNAIATAYGTKVKNAKSGAKDIAANNKNAGIQARISKAIEIIQRFFTMIVDLFRNVNLETLAKKVRASSKDQRKPFELTMQEMNSIQFLENIKDFSLKVQSYLAILEGRKKFNEGDAERELVKFKVSIEDYRLKQRAGDNAVGSNGKPEDLKITPEELAIELEKLHKQNIYRDITDLKKLFDKSATNFNTNSNVPIRIYNGIRDAIDAYIAEFRESIKTITKLVKAITSKEDMDVYSRGNKVHQRTATQELDDYNEAEKKVKEDFDKLHGKETVTKESWSMNLDEDADFF